MPEVLGVIVAEQLDVVALTLARVQGVPVNDPDAVPVLVNATVPAGALAVPAADVSLTNAVQVADWATTIVVGEHETEVAVVRSVTVTVLLVPVLAVWTPSLDEYVPLAMTVPALVGPKVTLQLEVVLLTLANVHGEPVKLPPDVPVLVNATVPPGADAVPDAVSLTNAVQLIDWATTTVDRVHEIEVEVDLVPPTLTVLLVPVLPL